MSQKATARSPTLMALHSDSHKRNILSKFDQLRKKDMLCDVTLVVEDMSFKAHRALLAASSEYFSLMLTAEGRAAQPSYRLHGMAAKTFAAVLEFIYSAQVSVEEAATEQLLQTARLMELSDLVEVLTELTKNSVSPAGGEEAQVQAVEKPEPTKRKRGRPKKIIPAAAAEPEVKVAPCDTLEEMWPGPADCDDAVAESQPEDDADYNPGTHRQSKRKIRPPVKYKSYKVDRDTAGGTEPGKRGRKRKYPNTEARCEDCDKVFKNHLFLKIHQRTHTGEKPFRCIFCPKGFTQKHTLLAHQRMHTGEKPFVCTVCSKALSTKHSLLEHMNLHQEKKSFSCEKCGKTFTQKRQLKSHYRVHTGKSLPECAQCHHKFMDTAQLKKHLRTHTGEKPFTCEICGKCFTAKSTLQTHIRIHKGEKPYDCSICNKSFSDPSARRRHVTSHSGKKPFTCSFCSLSFTRMDNLKTHTKSHNKERADASEEAAVEQEQQEEQEEEEGAARTATAAAPEEARSILQLQPYSEQEIQLVMTADVDNINFVPAQEQEISIITSEGQPGDAAQPRLTLLAPGGQGGIQNVALVSQGGAVEHGTHIQTISMLEQQPEHMHVITLSKEAMEQLQAQHGPAQPLQVAPARPVQQHGQAIHISSQSSQPISISQTSQQISSHHIQGQTFQIQAGTVSYLYTTGLPQQS